ncbi:MAG: hypothetical protein QNK40_08745 [Desulfobacterales bacterium]|nr:hypothetical protein [Desulfobacterales bacterium]
MNSALNFHVTDTGNLPRIPGVLRQDILPLGDLVMMRRQMINFKALCEKG